MAKQQENVPRIAAWLKRKCEENDLSVNKLHIGFIRQGGEVSSRTAARWLSGETEPTASDLVLILQTLDTLTEADIFGDFVREVLGDTNPEPVIRGKGKRQDNLPRAVTGKVKKPARKRAAARR